MGRSKPAKLQAPDLCPVCGEEVPRGALACPECGADHNSGWREGAEEYDGIGLPEEEFDYDAFVREEFGPERVKPSGIRTMWWITAIVLVVAMALFFLYAL